MNRKILPDHSPLLKTRTSFKLRNQQWKMLSKVKEWSEHYFQLDQKFGLVLILLVIFVAAHKKEKLETAIKSQHKIDVSSFVKDVQMDEKKVIVSIKPVSGNAVYNIESTVGINKSDLTLKELMIILKKLKQLKTIYLLADRQSPSGFGDDVAEMAASMKVSLVRVGKSRKIVK